MTNTMFPRSKAKFLDGDIDWEADDIVLVLLGPSYPFNEDHEFFNDLSDVLASAAMTTSIDDELGLALAEDLSVTGVSLGQTVNYMVIYKDTGTGATSPLIAYFDSNDDTTPINRDGDGAAIPVIWSSSPVGVFAL